MYHTKYVASLSSKYNVPLLTASDVPACGNRKSVNIKDKSQRLTRGDCFVDPVESFADDEFDFEKNLALFDKQAVFDEINRCMGSSGAACNAGRVDAKYKCDENVLQGATAVYRQIKVSGDGATKEYVTDSGLVVPSVTLALRERFFAVAELSGYGKDRLIEMVGRSASEMVLQLLGGVNR